MLAGIISSVVVAIAGAVSSFIAYQKKKLCFKASGKFVLICVCICVSVSNVTYNALPLLNIT